MIQCNYCREAATVRLVGTNVRCCATCRGLYSAGDWNELALRWLAERPGEWMIDVASFIEGTAPEAAQFESMRLGTLAVPADLAEPDPSDWTAD